MSEASDPSKPCLPAQSKDDVPGTLGTLGTVGTVPQSVPVVSPTAPAAAPAPASVPSGPSEGVGENFDGSVDKMEVHMDHSVASLFEPERPNDYFTTHDSNLTLKAYTCEGSRDTNTSFRRVGTSHSSFLETI